MVPFSFIGFFCLLLQDFASNWKIFLCLNLNPNLYNLPSRFKLEFSYHWMYPTGLFTEVIDMCEGLFYTWCQQLFQYFLGSPTNLIRVILWISRANAKAFQMVITSSVEEKPQPSNRMVANLPTESWIGSPDQNRFLPQSHLLRKPAKS